LAERTAEYNTRKGNTSFAGLLAILTSWHQESRSRVGGNGQIMEGNMGRALTDQEFYSEIGDNIKSARNLSGESQERLAEFLGVSFQQLQKYETGANRIPIDRLAKIADRFGMPLSEFLPRQRPRGEKTFLDLAGGMPGKEFHTLLTAWHQIESRKLRADLLTLIKDIAERP
jgi:transcriptional regulator with XRE-family HTH domain